MSGQLRRGTVSIAVGTIAVACLAGGTTSVPAAGLPSVDVPSAPSVPQVPQLPQLPQVPQVPNSPSVPDLPATPRLEPPSSLPNAPDVHIPGTPINRGPGGSQSTPTAPVVPGGGPGSTAPPGSTVSSAPAGASYPQARSARSGIRAGGREPSASRLRRTVGRLQGCFYAISRFERRVLRLRAGIGSEQTLGRTEVAERLGVSTTRVRSSEQHALRRLRAANRSDGCGRVKLGLHAESGTRLVVAAAQDGPSLQPVGSLASSTPSEANGSKGAGQGAVLGAHRSIDAGKGRSRVRSALASAGGDPSNGANGAILATIAGGLLLLSGVALLLLRRPARQGTIGAPYRTPSRPDFDGRPWLQPAARPEAAPVEEPSSVEGQARPWPRRPPWDEVGAVEGQAPPEPSRPARSERAPVEEPPSVEGESWAWPSRAREEAQRVEGAAPRWPTRPEGASRSRPPEPTPADHGARGNGAWRAGVLASGVASLVLGRVLGRWLRR
jgi:sigma-70-like protein